MKTPLKHYNKAYEDIVCSPSEIQLAGISTSYSSLDALSLHFKSFLREANVAIFNLFVKERWLEGQFITNAVPRRWGRKGGQADTVFAYFMKAIVGTTQQPLSGGLHASAIPKYFLDFFPDFFRRDPFKEPEYYKYPYEHVTLDHLVFVHQCHNRLQMLEEAEKKLMSIKDFINWAANWELSYADEMAVEGKPKMYMLSVENQSGQGIVYIKAIEEKPVKQSVYE